ncbi:cupin domain-containing protein [Staphylococcus delphini]|uniref:JmjC domain-containing protein n=1 Tax=Staphylococcus delphini TaxID=53344 RepID=UPI0015C9AE89|nr:cupin domain-containing protein [Staphylococcus delphini]
MKKEFYFLRKVNFDDFKNNYFDKKTFVTHGDIGDFPNHIDSFNKQDINDFLDIYDNPIMVVGDPIIDYTEGLSNRILVDKKNARYWYDKGCAIELDHFELFDIGLKNYIEALKQCLGLPNGCIGKSIIYAAKNGGGFPPHFDAYTNFIFQLKGEKEWKISTNENVNMPLEHYELVEYPFISDTLKEYWKYDGEVPKLNLENGNCITLKRGSFLYLARGDWHRTSSRTETLALNITFTIPKVIDYVSDYLKLKLSSYERYRMSVNNENLGIWLLDSFKQELINDITDCINSMDKNALEYLTENSTDVYQATQSTFRYMLSK